MDSKVDLTNSSSGEYMHCLLQLLDLCKYIYDAACVTTKNQLSRRLSYFLLIFIINNLLESS
jgi:hypothetical protein